MKYFVDFQPSSTQTDIENKFAGQFLLDAFTHADIFKLRENLINRLQRCVHISLKNQVNSFIMKYISLAQEWKSTRATEPISPTVIVPFKDTRDSDALLSSSEAQVSLRLEEQNSPEKEAVPLISEESKPIEKAIPIVKATAESAFAEKTFFRGAKPLYKGDEISDVEVVVVDTKSDAAIKIIGYRKDARRHGTPGYLAAGYLTEPLQDNKRQILWSSTGGEETYETISEEEFQFCLGVKWFDFVEGKNENSIFFISSCITIHAGKPERMRPIGHNPEYCCNCDTQVDKAEDSSSNQQCMRSNARICEDCLAPADRAVFESIAGFCTRCEKVYKNRAFFCLKDRYSTDTLAPSFKHHIHVLIFLATKVSSRISRLE